MDEPTKALLWIVGGAVLFTLAGALFGGIVGFLTHRDDRAGGTRFGSKVASALEKLFEQPLPEGQRAALRAAADGACFLGAVGVLVGLGVHYGKVEPSASMLPTFLLILGLLSGAIFFGLLAMGVLRLSVRVVFPLCLGGMVGALVTAHRWGAEHIVPGTVVGMVAGVLLHFLLVPKRSD